MTTVTLSREMVQQALDAPAQPVDCRGCKHYTSFLGDCDFAQGSLDPVCTNGDKFIPMLPMQPLQLYKVTK